MTNKKMNWLKSPRQCRLLLNCAVSAGVMLISLTAGAATIREIVNSNAKLCKQFVGVLKAAGVPNMTNSQLCKFHFDHLPAAMTKGFTFPQWTKLAVADPLVMYKRMVLANWPSNVDLGAAPHAFFATLKGIYEAYELLQKASRGKAIHFYTAMVPARPWSGLLSNESDALKRLPAEFHLVRMDVDFCQNNNFRFLDQSYAVSYRSGLRDPIDASDLSGGIIALWHGSLLKIYTGPTLWKPPGPGPLSIDAIASNLYWQPSVGYSNLWKQPIRAGFSGGPNVCWYSIEK